MSNTWQTALFETCPGGVSSAVSPELLPPGQFAWGLNISIRGAKPHTRPPIVERLILPQGLHQGSAYFGVQDGMIICSIAGRIYRLRIGANTFSYEEIPLSFVNSGVLKQVWFQQTVETLVIQDGQSNAILYDGSTARRAGTDEVPRGTAMAYGNGRLWVAINKNELVAGDIRTRQAGSELKFTETNYLSGGGALYFPRGITGLEFIPITGAADFGTLIVFSRDSADSIRADVTSRDLWAQMPGFVTNVFRNIGAAGDWSITQVNQDLYWRDGRGDIRSLANSISTNNTPGSTPISREVQRLVDYDSEQLLPWVSAIYFDNRLLMASSPYLNVSAGVSFKDIVALDFSPISTMQLKAAPAYDGQWSGPPGIAQLITGEFDGINRAFAISSGEDGINRLWEILTRGKEDAYISCGSGTIGSPVESLIEYPSVGFGLPKNRKRLERCDVWLSDIDGALEMRAFWRSDNTQKWSEWDQKAMCAKTTDAATNTPHTWKNLLPEQRPQIKTFTIPYGLDAVTEYALEVGFEFQIRLVFIGKYKVERMMLCATVLDDKDYADSMVATCIENDVTGNEIRYTIPVSDRLVVYPPIGMTVRGYEGGPFTPEEMVYTVTNAGSGIIDWTASASASWITLDTDSGTLESGESIDVTATVNASADTLGPGVYSGELLFSNASDGCGGATLSTTLTVSGDFPDVSIVFYQYDGPFEYPAWVPQYGTTYYLNQAMGGTNKWRYAPVGGNVGARPCDTTTGPDPSYGTVLKTFGGSVQWNLSDSSTVGLITASSFQDGTITAYDHNIGVTTNYTASSVAGILAVVYPASQRYTESQGSESLTQRWSTSTHQTGWFPGSIGGIFDGIYCEGFTTTATTSQIITASMLGIPVARSGGVGSDAQTQTTGDFDTGTRINSGQFSYAEFTVGVDASRDQITGTFVFTVTPTVGDPYTLTVIKDYEISGSSVTGTVDFPWFANAVIHMDTWTFSYQKVLCADYSFYSEGIQIVQLPESPSWPNPITYLAPPPNTNCWEDYSQYPTANANPEGINLIITGERWNGPATISSVDHLTCFENYSAYPVGDIYLFSKGVGWNGAGTSSAISYEYCNEDYSTYAVGPIYVYDFETDDMSWAGDGSSF